MCWKRAGGRSAVLAVALVTSLSAQAVKPAFEVASVKRSLAGIPPAPRTTAGAFFRGRATVESLIEFAYGTPSLQVIGGPDWVRRDRFDISARTAESTSPEQMQLMVQSLLQERFRLVVHRDRREMRHAALVLARSDGRVGSGLERCDDPSQVPPFKPMALPRDGVPLVWRCQPLSGLARIVATVLEEPVIDRTRLEGYWSFQIVYNPSRDPGPPQPALDSTPPFTTVLEERLGLKIQRIVGPLDVVIIESVQQPDED